MFGLGSPLYVSDEEVDASCWPSKREEAAVGFSSKPQT